MAMKMAIRTAAATAGTTTASVVATNRGIVSVTISNLGDKKNHKCEMIKMPLRVAATDDAEHRLGWRETSAPRSIGISPR